MRTDQEIVDQTNELARKFLSSKGFRLPKDCLTYKSTDPRVINAWLDACDAQIFLTDTDPNDAVTEVEA